ncbi:AMP-binding enzyme [Nocardia cyriacigeorgica]|uniref:AMP-binding enzyme n=1 Tax=Nocardia cyriacigeorgica TaxID=135487 RepID=UPI0028057B19|nr:hypothetical protein [Nocardia cyriacigeorgica]
MAAYVSLRDGHTAGHNELISIVRNRIAPYKRPRSVQILADLPKTHTGKIRRRELRDPLTPEVHPPIKYETA